MTVVLGTLFADPTVLGEVSSESAPDEVGLEQIISRRSEFVPSTPKGTSSVAHYEADTVDSMQSKADGVPKSGLQRRGTYDTVVQWYGEVIDLAGGNFTARLFDQSGGPAETGTFDINDVSTYDSDLLQTGATFYLTVSRHTLPSGQVKRESEIRFRRLPRYRAEDVERAGRRVDVMLAALGIEPEEEPMQDVDFVDEDS